jgi:outer membrane protein TolC
VLKLIILSKRYLAAGLALLISGSTYAEVDIKPVLTFEDAITFAQKADPWLLGSEYKQKATEAISVAAATLPDPKVSVSLANLPTDSLAFDQEGMTQFKVGITQVLPRGDSLEIKSDQLKTQSQIYPYQRADRQAQVAVTVGQLWLNAYRVQQSIALIEANRALFLQLTDIAQASYSSAVGKTRQQDIVRAQLELTRLEERLDKLLQQKNLYEGKLSQWLSNYAASQNHGLVKELWLHDLNLGVKLPHINLVQPSLIIDQKWQSSEQLVRSFVKHPAVLALDKKIETTNTSVALAKQKYKPAWALNASYGYRADDQKGNSRADLMSVGVSFDLPLFTANRQDKEVDAAIYHTEAVKTEKMLLLRKFLAAFNSAKGRLFRLKERQQLYREKLLPQMHVQAEASLTAYTNDDGDFAEVVRARIAVLNAEIDYLSLNVEQQKIQLELNYLFAGSLPQASEYLANKTNPEN